MQAGLLGGWGYVHVGGRQELRRPGCARGRAPARCPLALSSSSFLSIAHMAEADCSTEAKGMHKPTASQLLHWELQAQWTRGPHMPCRSVRAPVAGEHNCP